MIISNLNLGPDFRFGNLFYGLKRSVLYISQEKQVRNCCPNKRIT